MVPSLRGIIEHRAVALYDDALQRHVGILCALDKAVEIVDIGALMLAIVEVDCHRRDYGHQSVRGVGERWLSEFHVF